MAQDNLLVSSDGDEEDDDGQTRVEGDVAAADATVTERHVQDPAERITEQTGGENSRRTAKRRSKSKVWEKFTAVLKGGNTRSAECKRCKKYLGGKNKRGTSHLRRHLKICPAQPATVRVQERQTSPHPDSSAERNSMSDQDRSLELLTKALVSNLCPFSMTTDMNFRQFLAGTCPSYGVVSQSAVREKLQSIFQNEKLKLKEEIALAPGGVFLALARWGLESRYFVCVTAQFIDKEWNVIRKIIRCRFAGVESISQYEYISMLSDSQSYSDMIVWYDDDMGEHAEDIVNEVVKDWSLEGKLLGVSLPKSLVNEDLSGLQKNLAEQNYLLVKYKLLSLPCIIDLLHGLFEFVKTEFVQRVCEEWFKYMTCSPLRTKRYKEILSQLQTKQPSFGSQKWHLTFYMLQAALQFNKVLPNPTQIDFRCYPSKPSYEKLGAAENFCNLARLIYNAIEVISSPSSGMNSHIHKILSLKHDLKSSCRKRNMNQVFDLETMNKKFDEIWRNWYLWLCLAVILDPRYKFRFLTRSLGQAFGTDAARYMIEVRAKIYELFIRYSFHADQQSCELSNERTIDSQSAAHGHGSVPVHDTIQNFSDQSAHEKLGELIQYLEGECIPENVPFDILKWWKDNASTYPTLATLARDILAIPVSGISSESALDVTDERVSLFNRKMSPEQVEILICTQDWIKSSEINNEEVGGSRNMTA